jgi:hypothetical protein
LHVKMLSARVFCSDLTKFWINGDLPNRRSHGSRSRRPNENELRGDNDYHHPVKARCEQHRSTGNDGDVLKIRIDAARSQPPAGAMLVRATDTGQPNRSRRER